MHKQKVGVAFLELTKVAWNGPLIVCQMTLCDVTDESNGRDKLAKTSEKAKERNPQNAPDVHVKVYETSLPCFVLQSSWMTPHFLKICQVRLKRNLPRRLKHQHRRSEQKKKHAGVTPTGETVR